MRALLVFAAAGVLSGCGTILNFSMGVTPPDAQPPRTEIYGGVQIDAQLVGKAVDGYQPWWFNVLGLLFVFDVPLSLLADTITLPVTIPIALTRD